VILLREAVAMYRILRELQADAHGVQQLGRDSTLAKEPRVSRSIRAGILDGVVDHTEVFLERLAVAEDVRMLFARLIYRTATPTIRNPFDQISVRRAEAPLISAFSQTRGSWRSWRPASNGDHSKNRTASPGRAL